MIFMYADVSELKIVNNNTHNTENFLIFLLLNKIRMFGLIFQLVSLLCSLIWFLSNFTIFLIHYFFILILISFFISKFFKLKPAPFPKIFESNNSWCIAHYGANFDAPESSKASIEYVSDDFN